MIALSISGLLRPSRLCAGLHRRRAAVEEVTGRLTIGARSGTFKGMVENRVIKVRFIGAGAKPVGRWW